MCDDGNKVVGCMNILISINFSIMESIVERPPLRSPCFSSVNRHSHYNRQKSRFEKNIEQLHHTAQLTVPRHVKMIA